MRKKPGRSKVQETNEEETASRDRSTSSPPSGDRSTSSSPSDVRSTEKKTETAPKRTKNRRGRYVGYDAGPNREGLSARYGMDIAAGEAQTLKRLESDFGTDRVERWAEEGMPVATMGKPRDMAAFRERQAERPDEVPIDVERRNAASARRNAAHNQESGTAGNTHVPEAVRRVVSSPGRSLDGTVQREMEAKMGGELGDVRVHTGPRAAAAAESINARAFTVGNHVAFNEGEYRPDTDDGKRVLAHELAHVRQETNGAVSMLPKAHASDPGDGYRAGMERHVQPKLEVSSPDDPAEKEAEQVAEAVVAMDDVAEERDDLDESGGTPEPAATVRQSESGGGTTGGAELSGDTATAVREGVRGSGAPLPAETRSRFESRMGADFSNVRVHTDSTADEAARSIDAEAYTMGTDIAFAKGNYEPASPAGRELLAHELTHVVQQSRTLRARIQRQSPGEEDSGEKSSENGDGSDSGDDSPCDGGGPKRPPDNWLPDGWNEQTYELSADSCGELQKALKGEKPDCPNSDCEGSIGDVDKNVAATTCYCLTYDYNAPDWGFPQGGPYIRNKSGTFKPQVKEFEITTDDVSVAFKHTPVVIMPEWSGYQDADDPAKCAWNNFVRDLQEHERKHAEKAQTAKAEIEERLNSALDSWEQNTEQKFPKEIQDLSAKKKKDLKKKIKQTIHATFPGSGNKSVTSPLEQKLDKTFEQELNRVGKEQEELHSETGTTETVDCP